MAESTSGRAWLARHHQRLVYGLVALSLVATIGTTAYGGFLLRHVAVVQRQTQRTQALGQSALQIYVYSVAPSLPAAIGIPRTAPLLAARTAWSALEQNEPAEAALLRPAFEHYLDVATRALASGHGGRVSAAAQDELGSALAPLGIQIRAESARQEHEVNVTTPRARWALIAAAAFVALLVAFLVWQFELERRAGRIDRDNAVRSAELIRLRDEFVAVVSHELRTPLTSIVGYLELLEEDAATMTTEQRDHLATLRRSSDRLTELVDDLLLVAAAERGPLTLELAEVDVDALARHAVEAALPAADAKAIALTVAGGGAGMVRGERRRLAQLLDNLLSNAIKFTPIGGEVSLRATAEGGLAVVEVSDTGPGIPPADLEHLFEPFFRSHAAAAQSVPGTGLGLSIAKAIVDAHGGEIAVETREGGGTRFRVAVPALVAEPVAC